jgi:alpha-mannosidase
VGFSSEFQALQGAINAAQGGANSALDRFRAELDFAVRMKGAQPDNAAAWEPLLVQAARTVADGLAAGAQTAEALVREAEAILAPVGEAAKQYEVHCCGHAHIDMNWMWSWPETVAVTHDTFSTMDQLMDEFPTFRFSQSQVSVYDLTQKYAPPLWERVKQRVAEGRWEITASQWVEGDKNLASGEILARHLLYTRRWLKEHLGLPYDAVKIDWECDTFGHCWTLPGILARGGVSRYYHHRANGPRLQGMSSGEMSQLFWWEGKDGSRVLAYDDSPNGYNCEIGPHMTRLLFALEKHTGLRKLLWIYGVGDHGGGPTRRHLRAAVDMAAWPIFPQVILSTTDAYFSAVERDIEAHGLALPVHSDELNYVFEGCYTSESRIKFANRKGENDLVDTEVCALAGKLFCGQPYPQKQLTECWERSMFLQFHDILPGSGVKETVEHAMGLFQESLANTTIIRTRALRACAELVDTKALLPGDVAGSDLGLGGGAGNEAWWGGVSTLGAGPAGCDPFVVYNLAPFARDELVRVKIWNRDYQDGHVRVRDPQGSVMAGQIVERGDYWGHRFVVVAFPTRALPGIGFRAFVVEPGAPPAEPDTVPVTVKPLGRPVYTLGYVGAQLLDPVEIENEHLRIVITPEAGGITSCEIKGTETDIAGDTALGAIVREQEAPHGMTAWQLGTIVDRRWVLQGAVMRVVHAGPHVATVELHKRDGDSDYRLRISLAAGSRQVDFDLDVNWLERGDPATGVPMLRAWFPTDLWNTRATREIACGTIEWEPDAAEVPALNWVDLTGYTMGEGTEAGLTVLNDCKYGHSISEEEIKLTLIRSSYDPDPLPELGRHTIRFAMAPHTGVVDAAEATRAGYAFNHPVVPIGTTVHEGPSGAEAAMLTVRTDNVMFSGLKQAEDSEALILRLYEIAGRETEAEVWVPDYVAPLDAPVVETDLLEQPLAASTARREGETLTVTLPPYGIATVRIG